MLERIAVDTHTHTVLSGHAWSTLRENAAAAARIGLAGICLTEHGHDMPGSGPAFLPAAQKMLPAVLEGVRIYMGIEANIHDRDGGLDIDDRNLSCTEFCVASLHDITYRVGTESENTRAMLVALEHPYVDILGHIDDRRCPVAFGEVVERAGKLGKLIEINNNSLLVRKGSRERIAEVAGLCMRHGVRVCVASDAHFDTMIGEVGPTLELLRGVNFPRELVVNRDLASFEAYLAERAGRVGKEQLVINN